jgi:hypothetical protein
VGALINQTNLFFARTHSAIALPDFEVFEEEVRHLRGVMEEHFSLQLANFKAMWSVDKDIVIDGMRTLLQKRSGLDAAVDKVALAVESLLAPRAGNTTEHSLPAEPESESLAFRRAEFDVLRSTLDDPTRFPDLRVVQVKPPVEFAGLVSRVGLVERLKETRAFFGFDRLKSSASPLHGMPDSAMQQLFRRPPSEGQRWLPAVQVFGEGIYIEFDEEAIRHWQDANASWLEARLKDDFITRLEAMFATLPPSGGATRSWASRYLLVHTFAHILVNQLVFECGYSTASLRERLFVSSDGMAPMAATLIYTAAGDSEGTLGGLVRLGHPDRLGAVVQRALARALWCSADPVCSEHLGGSGPRLANLAACHACVLLPETSCETINHGLDRAMVVGTPEARSAGFMSQLLEYGDVALGS